MEHLRPEEIGAFLANSLSEQERDTVERHLVACAECRSELIEGQRAIASAPMSKRLRNSRFVVVAGLAAAAVLLITMLPREAVVTPGTPVERDASGLTLPAAARVEIVSPPANGELDTGSRTFTWKRDGSSAYNLTVTDESGRTLWSASTSDTTLTLPADVRLARDTRFFWYVDALRSDGRSITSGVNAFRTAR